MLRAIVFVPLVVFAAWYVFAIGQKTAANVRHSIAWGERLKEIMAQE